ncbi:conserved hypothetical protein [Hymenobacter roseosalivarius DSM 11622]|uniref:Uncharacterized protein n=2 Tax=Hymenobacter roseosalivarius TaxID=89967 RepID=A0A1W1W3M7_9BACT|nr:conserved hypothetical protein [Hymenobacter roseosalivarius DSM 11622]
MGRLPDPAWLIAVLAFTCLIPAHKVFNAALLASADVQATNQPRFSMRQLFLLVAFGILWILSILGMLLLEEEL